MSSSQNSSTPVTNLRDYQVEAVTALRENKRGIIAAATGAGKTTIMAASISEKAGKGKILVLVHLVKLVEQTAERIAKETGLEVGQYYNARKDDLDSFPVTVATWQSLGQLNEEVPIGRDYFYAIAVDEAHHVGGVFYDLVSYFTPEYLHGFTATPYGRGEAVIFSLFDRVIFSIDLFDLIKRKWLTPFHIELFDVSRRNLSESKIDEYNKKKMEYIQSMNSKLSREGRPVKVVHFFPRKSRIKEFMKANPNLKSVTIASGSTPASMRKEFRKFETPTSGIEHLYSIRILNEGVDIPIINGLVFHEHAGSLRTFIQRLGRGLRVYDDPKAKTYVQQFLEDDSEETLEVVDAFMEEVKMSMQNHKDDVDRTILDTVQIIPNTRVSRLLAEYRRKCAEREKAERLVETSCHICTAQIFKRAADVERLRPSDGFVCTKCQDGNKKVNFKCGDCDEMSLMSTDIYFEYIYRGHTLRCPTHARAPREERKKFKCSEPGCTNQIDVRASLYRRKAASGGKIYCDVHKKRQIAAVEVVCSVDGCGEQFSISASGYRQKKSSGHKFYCPKHKKVGKEMVTVKCTEPSCGVEFQVEKMLYTAYRSHGTPFRCEQHKRKLQKREAPVVVKCFEPTCSKMLTIRAGNYRARFRTTKTEPRFFCDEHAPKKKKHQRETVSDYESS